MTAALRIDKEVRETLREGRAVVALESTVIAHGLPFPQNLELAKAQQDTIRKEGALPAVIGLWDGELVVGLSENQIARFAQDRSLAKVSRRDMAAVLASRQPGATTVAATMIIAALAGIRLFATGGIGGVHRGAESSFDISADLIELGRTPVAVVSAGAKAVLDLTLTLEVLETHGVPVIGYGTKNFPAFYSSDSGLALQVSVDTPEQAAAILHQHLALGLGGLLIANPPPTEAALPREEVEGWIAAALAEAKAQKITGAAITPFLLAFLERHSGGRSSTCNRALLIDNARVAARIARALTELDRR